MKEPKEFDYFKAWLLFFLIATVGGGILGARNRDRIEPVMLIVVAFALFAAALWSYTGHPVRDSNLYSPHAPGWIAVVLFFLIGIAGRLIYIRDQRRTAKA